MLFHSCNTYKIWQKNSRKKNWTFYNGNINLKRYNWYKVVQWISVGVSLKNFNFCSDTPNIILCILLLTYHHSRIIHVFVLSRLIYQIWESVASQYFFRFFGFNFRRYRFIYFSHISMNRFIKYYTRDCNIKFVISTIMPNYSFGISFRDSYELFTLSIPIAETVNIKVIIGKFKE